MADAVLTVRVLSATQLKAKDVLCGFVYEATVERTIKGSQAAGSKIRFGYLGGLESGRAYTVYLKNDPTGTEFIARLRAGLPSNADVEAMAPLCQSRYDIGVSFFRVDQ